MQLGQVVRRERNGNGIIARQAAAAAAAAARGR